MKVVDCMFASFFALLKLVKKKRYDSRAVKLPHYLPKDGFAPLVIQQFFIRNQIFTLTYSKRYGADHSKISIKVPPILEGWLGKKPTNRQGQLAGKRKLRMNDYISKACRKVIRYCLLHNIGVLVCGYNVTFQQSPHMGKVNNQNFVNIPYGEMRKKLEYLCEIYGIEYIEQEESYTSKASFCDKDEIPVYNADNPRNTDHALKNKAQRSKLLNNPLPLGMGRLSVV